jgi:hypothetical protein
LNPGLPRRDILGGNKRGKGGPHDLETLTSSTLFSQSLANDFRDGKVVEEELWRKATREVSHICLTEYITKELAALYHICWINPDKCLLRRGKEREGMVEMGERV